MLSAPGGILLIGWLGIGAINEMIEFGATVAHAGTHVGGYDNTGWDLVSNTLGALAAATALEVTRRTQPRPTWSAR